MADGVAVLDTRGTDIALDGAGSRQRASLRQVQAAHIEHPDRNSEIQRYFNTGAFLRPAESTPGSYGNSGRNILTDPACQYEPGRVARFSDYGKRTCAIEASFSTC
ncbi:MAG: hypothetical protein WKF37_18985 [Bryobacteraceae bacterium]